jgi:serine/threonine-protein kinase HipA
VKGGDEWHRTCVRELFGSASVPTIDVDLARFQTLALATVGQGSLSGIQRKLSLSPSQDGRTLRASIAGSLYILKPQSRDWDALPENEHLTMNLARLSGIETPPLGLVTLLDGSSAYIVRRFDRALDGRKRACEDFCQLAELAPKDKYAGSIEACAKLVSRFATEPIIEALAFFRQALFAWWTGDGDLHRKNLSLVREDDASWRLSPAYDRVSTHLLIPRDELALTVQGKRSGLKRKAWLALAENIGLPARSAARTIETQRGVLDDALAMTERSALPAQQVRAQSEWLRRTSAALAG